jgi:hypothetical protein
LLWEWRFRILGLAAASMLWVNHAPGLQALGASGGEFYRAVWLKLSRFICRLRRQCEDDEETDRPPVMMANMASTRPVSLG